MTVPYGSLLLFSNALVHRSLPNLGHQIRWSMDFRWQVGWSSEEEVYCQGSWQTHRTTRSGRLLATNDEGWQPGRRGFHTFRYVAHLLSTRSTGVVSRGAMAPTKPETWPGRLERRAPWLVLSSPPASGDLGSLRHQDGRSLDEEVCYQSLCMFTSPPGGQYSTTTNIQHWPRSRT